MRVLMLVAPLLLLLGFFIGVAVAGIWAKRRMRTLSKVDSQVVTAARRLALADVLTAPTQYQLRLSELQYALDESDRQKAL